MVIEYRATICPLKYIYNPHPRLPLSLLGGASVVVYSWFVVAPILCVYCIGYTLRGVVLGVFSSLAITSLKKRELVALWLSMLCVNPRIRISNVAIYIVVVPKSVTFT